MTCPLEKQMASLLDRCGIDYTRPEQDRRDPTNLDFYLPDFDLYVEVKQFHTPRVEKQLELVPKKANALVLQGMTAVLQFERLCTRIGSATSPSPKTPQAEP